MSRTPDRRGSHVLVIGGPGVGAALRDRGLVPVDRLDTDIEGANSSGIPSLAHLHAATG